MIPKTLQHWSYHEEEHFIHKLKELVESGVRTESIQVFMPHYVSDVEQILKLTPKPLEWITGVGTLIGAISALAMTYMTANAWPLITGGKPITSLMQYGILGIEFGLLFGGLTAFVGFVGFAKFPKLKKIIESKYFEADQFHIFLEPLTYSQRINK